MASSWLVTLQLWNPLVYKSILVRAILIWHFFQCVFFCCRIYSVVAFATVFFTNKVSFKSHYDGRSKLFRPCKTWRFLCYFFRFDKNDSALFQITLWLSNKTVTDTLFYQSGIFTRCMISVPFPSKPHWLGDFCSKLKEGIYKRPFSPLAFTQDVT